MGIEEQKNYFKTTLSQDGQNSSRGITEEGKNEDVKERLQELSNNVENLYEHASFLYKKTEKNESFMTYVVIALLFVVSGVVVTLLIDSKRALIESSYSRTIIIEK